MNVLYISSNGMTDPLGRSQVLEYLIELSKNHNFFLISFERKKVGIVKDIVRRAGIEWYHFNYSNRFGLLSTFVQVLKATVLSYKLIKMNKISIVHSRSIIPGVIGFILKKMTRVKHLFDIRGFAVDEKIDSGRLRKGALYWFLKKIENHIYKNADYLVTLSDASKNILQKRHLVKNLTVIPTCTSIELFRKLSKDEKKKTKFELGLESHKKIVIHTGTVSGWYDFESEVQLFKKSYDIDNDLVFLVLNQGEHNFIRKTFNKFNVKSYIIRETEINNVYKYLNISDVSLFFIKPTYAKIASMATKFGENLACNLYSFTNEGIGDMKKFMETYDVGNIIDLKNLKNNLECHSKELLKLLYRKDISDDFDILFNGYFNKKNAIYKYLAIYKEISLMK